MEEVRRATTADRAELHQAAIAENFHAGVQPLLRREGDSIELRSYQPRVVQDLDGFMVETQHDLNRAILIPEAGNFGKSFMSIVSMDLAGVGKVVPETGDKMRGLFLTSRVIGIKQALETYRQVTPHLKVESFSEAKNQVASLDIDVYVLAYQAVALMSETSWRQLINGRDIVAADEAHRAIGPKVATRLLMAREVQRPTILASTATPKFNDSHTVSSVLGINRRTAGATPRDAIHMGAANEAKLIALYSGEEVDFTGSPSAVLPERDLQRLAQNASRNKLILNVMADMAEAGRPGIVQLVPGGNSRHAQNMARWARGKNVPKNEPQARLVTDPMTGEKRALRVQALGSFQSPTRNMDYLKQLDAGELDAVTFTKYATETLDLRHGLGYVFNGSPIGSWADINQLTARGFRFFGSPTLHFSLIDHYKSDIQRRIYTVFDVFRMSRFFQGREIRRRQSDTAQQNSGGKAQPSGQVRGSAPSRPSTAKPDVEKPPRHPVEFGHHPLSDIKLSPDVQEAVYRIPAGTILDELLLTKASLEAAGIPPGYIPLKDLKAVQEGRITAEVAAYTLAHQISQSGKPLIIRLNVPTKVSPKGMLRCVLAEEAEAIVNERAKTIRFSDVRAFLEELNWPDMSLHTFAALLEEAHTLYNPDKKLHISHQNAQAFLLRLLETPLVDPRIELPIVSVGSFIGVNGASRLAKVIGANQNKYAPFVRRRRQGIVKAYRLVETMTLEGVALLLTDITQNQARRRKSVDITRSIPDIIRNVGIDKIIASAQKEYFDGYKDAGIDPRALTRAKIDTFLARYTQRPQEKPEQKQNTESAESTGPDSPPDPLDSTYEPSGLGRDWVHYTNCMDEDPELFFGFAAEHTDFSKKQLAAAKAICKSCTVKSECLQFGFDTASEGVFGGFSREERKRFSPAVRDWLKAKLMDE